MRQVPQYLIVGNGRLAAHFKHYFNLLSLSYLTWQRDQSIDNLHEKMARASHVLLMIKDEAIDTFTKAHLSHGSHCLFVHFSGCLFSSSAYGAHPLMTFTHDLYDLILYQAIPFVIDEDAPAFNELLPFLPNPHARLNKREKEKYHAMCVLAGNFSCLLWQKLFTTFQYDFQLPKEIAYLYLQQQMHNMMKNEKNALTGPLVRKDIKTIEKNIAALRGDPFQQVYQSFVSCYKEITKRGGK